MRQCLRCFGAKREAASAFDSFSHLLLFSQHGHLGRCSAFPTPSQHRQTTPVGSNNSDSATFSSQPHLLSLPSPPIHPISPLLAVSTMTHPVAIAMPEKPKRRKRAGRRIAHSREEGKRRKMGKEEGRRGCAGGRRTPKGVKRWEDRDDERRRQRVGRRGKGQSRRGKKRSRV